MELGDPPRQHVQHRAELLGERQPGPHLLAHHAGDLHVHRVRHELAREGELHGARDVRAGAVLGLVRRRAEVRGDDHLRQLEQRARRGGLGDVDVDARTADVPAADRLGQRLLVDQAAAGGVDDQHAGLGQRQLVLADEAEGLGRLGQVDRDHVGPPEQLVQAHQLDAELRGAGGRDVRVEGDQPDVEGGQALRDELADLAEAHDADGLAVQLDTGVGAALPLPAAQARVRGRDVPGGGEQQGDRVLGGGDDVRRGRVDDHHAAGRRGGHVDVVQAHPGAGDDLQPGGGRQRLGVDLGRRPHEQRVRVGERTEQGRPVRPVDVADLDVVAEQRDRGGRELLGEQDDRAAGGGGAHGGAVLPDRGRWSGPMVVGRPAPTVGRGVRMHGIAEVGHNAAVHPSVEAALPQIRELCQRLGVARLDLFGSASGTEPAEDPGDVDVLVRFGPVPPASCSPRTSRSRRGSRPSCGGRSTSSASTDWRTRTSAGRCWPSARNSMRRDPGLPVGRPACRAHPRLRRATFATTGQPTAPSLERIRDRG